MNLLRYVRVALFIGLIGVVAGCRKEYAPGYNEAGYKSEEDESDYVWDNTDETLVTLAGYSASIDGEGAGFAGGEVWITSAGNYRITGSLGNGRIVVNSNDDGVVRLILDGADITCSNSSAIFIKNAQKAVIILEEGSENSLTDGSSYNFDDVTDKEPAATIYSKTYLGIAGTGSLSVTGRYLDGIVGKDGLVIKSGTISVGAVDDGIRGNDLLLVHKGDITIQSGGKALKSDAFVMIEDGTIQITSDDDAIHSDSKIEIDGGEIQIASGDDAVHADSMLTVNGGDINITRCYEGLESISVNVNGGTLHLVSSDDGLNAADGSGGGMPGMPGMPPGGGYSSGSCNLKITGGYIWVNASGDGIDINGSVQMTGGTLIVDGPTSNNNGALDYDGTCKVTGGTIVGIGSSGMAQAPGTGSTVYSVIINFSTQQAAGTIVAITNSSGDVVFCAKNSKKFQSVVYCSPSLVKGTYDVYLGGSSTGTLADGVYSGGSYTPGTKYKSFTVSGILTQVR